MMPEWKYTDTGIRQWTTYIGDFKIELTQGYINEPMFTLSCDPLIDEVYLYTNKLGYAQSLALATFREKLENMHAEVLKIYETIDSF